ncbi:MAG: hypothetical protein ACRDQH_15635 [Pseudonocardiaceae bacterium]
MTSSNYERLRRRVTNYGTVALSDRLTGLVYLLAQKPGTRS